MIRRSILRWFQEAPVWNMYWSCLWALHVGIDQVSFLRDDLNNTRYHEAFRFLRLFAGEKNPQWAGGAFIALRGGLDAADVHSFPENTFGQVPEGFWIKEPLYDRARRIVAKFSEQGASLGKDPVGVFSSGFMENRRAKSMSDVGWKIHAGNYQRYITQLEVEQTSTAWWRMGSKCQPYGRFARSFKEEGPYVMGFSVNPCFLAQVPEVQRSDSVRIRIVYLDRGTASWQLKIRAAAAAVHSHTSQRQQQQADALSLSFDPIIQHTNEDSGLWKQRTAVITKDQAAVLGRGRIEAIEEPLGKKMNHTAEFSSSPSAAAAAVVSTPNKAITTADLLLVGNGMAWFHMIQLLKNDQHFDAEASSLREEISDCSPPLAPFVSS
mmetsp:Transcript_24873/g.34725  ORF Transcript_24873/g.34725 Transcript_24873/m.34725 type:complete len:380 (+) Transcript_24873:2-1141(+)